MTHSKMRSICEQYGSIQGVKVLQPGIGFCCFENAEDAKKCLTKVNHHSALDSKRALFHTYKEYSERMRSKLQEQLFLTQRQLQQQIQTLPQQQQQQQEQQLHRQLLQQQQHQQQLQLSQQKQLFQQLLRATSPASPVAHKVPKLEETFSTLKVKEKKLEEVLEDDDKKHEHIPGMKEKKKTQKSKDDDKEVDNFMEWIL
eukprot:TRINITY_DN481_c0_g1_i1.p1 TRINITY_DN481_c0_g1~~TRINITY_DN481_c0_g1_i1.p1  ORF type:complete len:234 (-),score=74.58 TRINITY_DN481_c0_g1_i1:139-738(-)